MFTYASDASHWRNMRGEVAQRSPVSLIIFCLLAMSSWLVYAGDAAVTATSRQPKLVISHLETDINKLEHWPRRLEDRHRRLGYYRCVVT